MAHLTHWLYTNVLGNLIASTIWGLPTGALFLAHHLHMRAHLKTLHTKVDALLGQDDASDRG